MSDRLLSGQELRVNGELESPSARFQLLLQDDGNLVIYDRGENGRAIWSSGTNGKAVSRAVMQTDGNFVIYGFPETTALWATNTSSVTPATLILQDDGNLVVYRWVEYAIWSAGSEGL